MTVFICDVIMMPKHAAHLGTLHENVCSCGVFNSLEDQVDQWLLDLLAVRWGPENHNTLDFVHIIFVYMHACVNVYLRVSPGCLLTLFDP